MATPPPSLADLKARHRLYYYAAHVTSVYDGDTITVDLDLGCGIVKHDQRIRLFGIDTPELRGPERAAGLATRDYVRGQILDQLVIVRTQLDRNARDRGGKFGRLLGEIVLQDPHGAAYNFNEHLVLAGHARTYDSTVEWLPVAWPDSSPT